MKFPQPVNSGDSSPPMAQSHFSTLKFRVLTTVMFILLCYTTSLVPYLVAYHKQPAQMEFLGNMSNYPDYNAYFSFIRQAYDGYYLFNNRETYLPSNRIFINLEWLVLGKIMHLFDLSENALMEFWRFSSAVFAVAGFALLAAQFNLSRRRWFLALAVFSLGGGIGTVAAIASTLHFISAETMHKLTSDLWGNLHPFQLVMVNPHASLTLGIVLASYGLFLAAEKKQSFKLSFLSGLGFAISGLTRPYEMICISAILPIFVVLESRREGFSLKNSLRRLIPVFCVIPPLLYNVWIFKIDPVYKHWGEDFHKLIYQPPIYLYFLAFGLPGWLALNRLLQMKRQPLSVAERFLTVWFFTVLGIIYTGSIFTFISFSPAIVITLMSPLILLGFSCKPFDTLPLNLRLPISPKMATGLTLFLVLFANLGTSGYYSLKFFTGKAVKECYADERDIQAWHWINANLPKDKVVLALGPECNRLAKYTSLRVVNGNWAVAPHYYEMESRLDSFFSSSEIGENELGLLRELAPDYIYFGRDEKSLSGGILEQKIGVAPLYTNTLVSIYKLPDGYLSSRQPATAAKAAP
jgi:hypothetical protein